MYHDYRNYFFDRRWIYPEPLRSFCCVDRHLSAELTASLEKGGEALLGSRNILLYLYNRQGLGAYGHLKHSKQHWINLAKRRIENILRARLLANEKQLESKIAEAGPEDKRCDPHIISEALRLLQKENLVLFEEGPFDSKFYYWRSAYSQSKESHTERKEYLFSLYLLYRKYSQQQALCGDCLESVIGKAISTTQLYNQVGSQKHQPIHFGDVKLSGAVDFVLIPKKMANSAVLIESKNIREWIYPSSMELWQFIERAVTFTNTGMDTLPVFVARKIQQSTRYLFKSIGILGVDTHRQLFDPSIATELSSVRHKDGFGFHDISFETEPSAYLTSFFEKAVPRNFDTYQKSFADNRELLADYAPRFLKPRTNRLHLWHELAKDLRITREDHDY